MLTSAVINYGLGALLKGGTAVVGTILQNRHEYMVATSNAQMEKLEKMYGGDEKLVDKMSRRTRGVLAIMLTATWCIMIAWIILRDPYMHFRIQVDQMPGVFSGLFGPFEQKTTQTVSAGSILWNYLSLMEMMLGYYFTRVGKSR